jgi:hypothetical protein
LASAPPACSDPADVLLGSAAVAERKPRRSNYTYALGLMTVLLSVVGIVTYWGISAEANRPARPMTGPDMPASVASAVQSAVSGAPAPSQQSTTTAAVDIAAAVATQSPVSLSQDAPAAAAAPAESGQLTASAANRSGAIVPPAGGSISGNAPEQSEQHAMAPDVAMPEVAAPEVAAPEVGRAAGDQPAVGQAIGHAEQAGVPPASPLLAAPTQGPVTAASAAAPVEPASPQADMPLAALTQRPVRVASVAMPAESQATPAAAPVPSMQAPGVVAAATNSVSTRAPMPSATPAQHQATADRAMADLYAARGADMLEIRDFSAARRFYEAAANAGSGLAAMMLARTYDPAFLSHTHAIGLTGDPVLAATWYRRAVELGVPEATAELRALTIEAAK